MTALHAAVITKGSVSHPGGNFCSGGSFTFVSNGGDITVIYQDFPPVIPGLLQLDPPAPEGDQFSYGSNPVVTVSNHRGLASGQQYELKWTLCADYENYDDTYTVIEDACQDLYATLESAPCSWVPQIIDFGTILLGQTAFANIQLYNGSTQWWSDFVGLNCPEFSITDTSWVTVPPWGQTAVGLRYTPTIENTVVSEILPTCTSTIVLGAAIGPRLVVGSQLEVLRTRLSGEADTWMSGLSANHKDFAVDIANADVFMAAQYTSGDTNDGIYKGTLDGNFTRIVTTANPWGVDFDPVTDKVYWAAGGTIRRANVDGSAVEDLPTPITFSAAHPTDLVIDSQARLLFWVRPLSANSRFIMRATLDGAGGVAIAAINTGGNLRLALDLTAGHVYWTEDSTGRIRRTRVDGGGDGGVYVQTLLTPEIVTPVAIALDPAERKIYWSEAGTNSVHRVDIGGDNHAEIMAVSQPTGLLLVRLPVLETERLFWVDATSDVVTSAPKSGGLADTLVASGLSSPRSIDIDPDAGKVYWIDSGTDKIYRANFDGTALQELVGGLSFPRGFALDPGAGKMYWTNVSLLQRANLDGTGVETLHDHGTSVEGLALDLLHGHLYWTDFNSSQPKIYRANLDGTGSQIVLTGSGSPAGIAVDAHGGMMYWTDYINSVIRRARLDGTDVQDLVTSGVLSPAYIDLDLGARKMYWTDAGTGKIQRANLDGSGVEDVRTLLPGPRGIAVQERAGFPVATDVDDVGAPRVRIHLDVPRPNPFNPSTRISYAHAGGVLDVAIYDVRGRLVRTLVSGPRPPGDGTLTWEGKDDHGRSVPSGLYLVKLRSNGHERTSKAVLVR